jgi:hypothetical protein
MVALRVVPENIIELAEFEVLTVIIRIIIHQEQIKNQGMFDNLWNGIVTPCLVVRKLSFGFF